MSAHAYVSIMSRVDEDMQTIALLINVPLIHKFATTFDNIETHTHDAGAQHVAYIPDG